MVTIDEIRHLEELSNLEFSEEQRQKFVKEFESIVEFASQISNVPCDKDGFINTIKLADLREDKAKESLPQDKVVSNAPDKKKGCFVVPRIME